MLTPLIGGFGWQEMLIILAIVLILFGGSRLAGLGKSTGRALREFKEETKTLSNDKDKKAELQEPGGPTSTPTSTPPETVEPQPRVDPNATETRRDV